MKKILMMFLGLMLMTNGMAQMPGGRPEGEKPSGKLPKGGKPDEKQSDKKKKVRKKKIQVVSDVVDAHGMYVYGIAYSPIDSIVYVTEQQSLDDAQIHLNTKFLVARNELSNQLRNHMMLEGEKNRTCCVVYNKDPEKLDKKYKKLLKHYQKRGFLVKLLDNSRFTFKAVRTEYTEGGYAVEEKEIVVED